MSSPEALFKATLSRLFVRFGSGLSSCSEVMKAFAKETPERIRQEWDSFQDEVFSEADRIDKESEEYSYSTAKAEGNSMYPNKTSSISDLETQIDRLRSKVSELSLKVEGRP